MYYVYIVHYVRRTAPREEEDEISPTLVQSIQLQFDQSKLSEYVGKIPRHQLQPLHTPSPQQERVDPTYTIFPDSLWLTLCI